MFGAGKWEIQESPSSLKGVEIVTFKSYNKICDVLLSSLVSLSVSASLSMFAYIQLKQIGELASLSGGT